MKDLSIIELYAIKGRIIKEGMSDDILMSEILEAIKYKEELILEDTSATGGSGMGAIVSAQPSGLAGQTIGPNWASNGGTTGSGDVSVPYNPSGSNRVFQQVEMGKEHGPRTGKKSRKKKLDIKSLRDVFSKKQDYTKSKNSSGEKKIMDFNDFDKSDINKVKR